MAKFRVLAYNQIFLSFLGIRFDRSTQETSEFFTTILPYCFLFVSISGLISSSVFIYMNRAHLENVFQSSIVFIAMLQSGGMFISFGLKIKQVKAVHFHLQDFVNEQDPLNEVSDNYWQVEQKCRRFAKTATTWFIVNHAMTFAALAYSLYSIAIGNYDTSNWILPLDLFVPFGIESLFGWYSLWTFNLLLNFVYGACLSSTIIHFLCCCSYIDGICGHLQLVIQSLQRQIRKMRTEKIALKNPKNIKEIAESLCKAVEIQVKAFEVFDMLAEINNGVIFSLLPLNAIIIAVTMYSIEHISHDFVSFSFLLPCAGNALFWPFLFCYFASETTDQIARTGFTVYECDWFDFPPKYQKYLILIIARSQKPAHFTGFKLLDCTVEMFGKTIKTSSSYYAIFRSFAQH